MKRFELAKAHVKNRQKIWKALTQLNRSLNQAIRENKTELQQANVRSMMILYAAYLESSLRYLVHFYGAQISTSAKDRILSQRSEVECWRSLLDHSFRTRFLKGKNVAINLVNLGHTNFHRYKYLVELLEEEIQTIIEIRNKLAHGQWAIAFTSDSDEKNQIVTTRIWTLQKRDILAAKNIVVCFLKIVEMLIASDRHFKKEFDAAVHRLENTKREHRERYEWILKDIKRRKWAFE